MRRKKNKIVNSRNCVDVYIHIVLIVVSNVEKREEPKGTSQTSLKYWEQPLPQSLPQPSTAVPLTRRNLGGIPPLEPATRDNSLYRRGPGSSVDDMVPLISIQNQPRQPRLGDVSASANLPEYHRPNERDYPRPTRKKSGPGESGDVGSYVGHSPEHEQPLPYVGYFTSVSFCTGPVLALLTRLFFVDALIF